MQYNVLSTTDTKVSKACLGTMSFGAHVDEPTSIAVMDRSLELGINFFDTAELYAVPPMPETCGVTESIIGRWMQARKNRDKIVLATKVVGPAHGCTWIRDDQTSHGSEKDVREALEGSLKRLQTDYIDLYQLHWPERPVHVFGERYFKAGQENKSAEIETILTVLQKLQKEGKVKHFGLSNETPWGTIEFLRQAREKNLPRMVSVQNNYSLLTRTYDVAMSEVSQEADIGLLAYSPLGFGVLGGRYLDGAKPAGGRFTKYPDFLPRYQSAVAQEATKKYKKLAEQNNMSLVEMALAFVYQRPYLTSNIIGPSNIQQLEECVAAINTKLSDELLKGIDEIDAEHPNVCP